MFSRALLLLVVALPLTGAAQTVVYESFESGAFTARDGGFTALIDTDDTTELEWVADAAVVGSWSMRLSRPMVTGTGVANTDRLDARFPPLDGTVTAQAWVRIESTSGSYGVLPIQFHGLNSGVGTNAELSLVGASPVFGVNTGGRRGFHFCSPTVTPDAGQWVLLELVTTGNGSDAGVARGFVNGVESCRDENDWSGLPVYRLFVGGGAYYRQWAGALWVDEVRVVQGIPVHGLEVQFEADGGSVGACLVATVRLTSIDDAGVLDRPLLVTASVNDGVVMDERCTTVSGSFDGGSFPLRVGVRPSTAGVLELSVSVAGLLPGVASTIIVARDQPDAGADAGEPDSGRLDAGSPDASLTDAGLEEDAGSLDAGQADAGQADAGRADAGQPDAGADGGVSLLEPERLAIGCSCAGGASPWVLLLMMLVGRGRTVRRVTRS